MSNRQTAEVFPPGEFIKEELEARGWSQIEFAEIIARPPRVVSELISAKRAITPETARALGAAFGTSAQFWLNLESLYQLKRTQDFDDTIARRAKLYQLAPVKEMVKRQWLKRETNVAMIEKQILKFFNLQSLDETPKFQVYAARQSTPALDMSFSQRAWLFRTKHLSRKIQVKKFSMKSLEGLFNNLKALLAESHQIRQIPHLLADAGIRFLVVEPLPKTRIDGASFWLENQYPVVALSLRYDRIDWFWFTLLHELAHIKNRDSVKDSSPVNLDVDLAGKQVTAHRHDLAPERKANQFASDFLIPQSKMKKFEDDVRLSYSLSQIRNFARQVGVHPGIVVGQLQYRQIITYAHYRRTLEKVRHIITPIAVTDGWGTVPIEVLR